MNKKTKVVRRAKEMIMKSDVMISTCIGVYGSLTEELKAGDVKTVDDVVTVVQDILYTFGSTAEKEREEALKSLNRLRKVKKLKRGKVKHGNKGIN